MIKKYIIWLMVITLLLPVNAVLAQENSNLPAEKQLSIQQAYEMAIKNSRALRQADLTVDRAREVKDLRLQSVDYIPSGPSPTLAASIWTAAVMADIQLQMAIKSKSVEEEKLYLSVVEKYNNLLKAEENLAYSRQSIQQARAQKRINELSLALGVMSDMQYKIGYHSFEASSLGVDTAQTTLDKAYTEFNNLLGLSITERPILTDRVSFAPLPVEELESVIHRTLDADPTIWMQEQTVSIEALQLDLYSYDNPARDPYEAEKIDVDKANLSAQETRSQMKQMMRSLYSSMRQLEDTYKMKQQLAIIADQNLEMKKVMYEVGMVSKIDMTQAELDAAKAHLDLNEIAYQYASLKLAFEKPWAYVANLNSR